MRNPQHDAAQRSRDQAAIDSLGRKLMRPDGRNIGVATRLYMPEVMQTSATDLTTEAGEQSFIVGSSTVGGDDVVTG